MKKKETEVEREGEKEGEGFFSRLQNLDQPSHPEKNPPTPKKKSLTARPAHLVGHLLQVDAPHQVHLPRVDPQDVDPRRLGRVWELDLAVDTARPQ